MLMRICLLWVVLLAKRRTHIGTSRYLRCIARFHIMEENNDAFLLPTSLLDSSDGKYYYKPDTLSFYTMPSYRNMALSMFLLSLKNTGTLGFGLRTTSSSIATSARRTISSNTSPLYSTAAVEATADEKKKETSSNIPIKNEQAYSKVKMDDIVSLCKRRGIIFPSSEIYNGFAGFFDYGPLGSELKRNVKDAFWTNFVQCREDVVGIDSSIIHNPTTWQSSGHLDGFSDPMVDCKETKLRYRADQLFCAPVILEEDDTTVGYVCVMEANDDDMKKAAKTQAKKLLREQDKKGQKIKSFDFVDLTQIDEETMAKVPSPGSGTPTLTMPRDFNLMFQTQVGAQTDASSLAYLRPETAQGIFINYKNVLGTSRQKLPFGIAQIGKAFRNEITPRNFIFRSREFEQMEIEYFIPPGDDVWGPYHEKWIADARAFLESVGLKDELMGYDVHEGDGLAHYARACTDITFKFPFGEQELMGIAARGNFDLTSHTEGSGKGTSYFVCVYCAT